MKAIILSAGEGSRMRPLTLTKPKTMLPVAGKPIIQYNIEFLRDVGIKDILLIVKYKEEMVRDYFQDGSDFGVNITYKTQKEFLGTASSGVSYEMYAVIACVLGGINMAGGRGELLGVAFGAISYSAVSMIIVSVPGLSVDIQNAFQGLVLITVILIQLVGPMIKEKMRQIKKRKTNKAIEG